MAKIYDIHSEANFLEFVAKMSHYFTLRGEKSLPFQRLTITCKQWRKPKTAQQHKKYWVTVSELKKAFISKGYDTNEDEVHEFLKKKAGFTKELCGIMVVKSIKDASDDATSNEMNRLIEVAQRFSAEELGVVISDEGSF